MEQRPELRGPLLSPREARAVRSFVDRVRRRVPADLVQASLFGSKARGQARPDSDLDVLLVFRRLPPDREPHATQAEQIAARVAGESGVPVTTWSVSLVDLARGCRTPMLVDALEDSIPLWWAHRPLRPIAFTPADALYCASALLRRVEEGSEEFSGHLSRGRWSEAGRRVRDDVVRLCTAALLLRGVTRPRRGEAVLHAIERVWRAAPLPTGSLRVLAWAAASFGPEGRDEEAAVPPPPGGLPAAARTAALLHGEVTRAACRLGGELRGPRASGSMQGHRACR